MLAVLNSHFARRTLNTGPVVPNSRLAQLTSLEKEAMERAISIVIFDPRGTQKGETYPPNSTWFWNDGRKQRKTRSDAGTGQSAAERQSRSRNREMSQLNQNLGTESAALTGSEFQQATI